MSRDFDKAQEMVWASMEYVKVLGFRLRRTEGQRDDWKQVAQSHAEELIQCRQQIDVLKSERNAERKAHDEYKERNRELFNQKQRLTAELVVIKDERDALRAQIDTERERYKQTPCDPPASHDTPAGKEAAHAAAEPKPGDVVRLVRVPTCNDYGHAWILEWGAVGNMGKVCKIRSYPFGNVAVVDIDARLSYEWPLSCVEVVRGGDK